MAAFEASFRVVSIFELRQYTLHPGRRDDLIELFEREFVEPQEAVGIRVVGTFRDLGDPDRFVWIRGFADMTTRLAGLEAFYGGPVWRAHRDAANTTMIDSDDVLLLEPADGEFAAIGSGPSTVLAAVHVDGEPDLELVRKRVGVPVVALRTSELVNDFTRLPVRDDTAVVWFASFADPDDRRAARSAIEDLRPTQVLALEPTARSRYR